MNLFLNEPADFFAHEIEVAGAPSRGGYLKFMNTCGSSIASVAARATSLASPVAGGTGLAPSPAASAAAAPPPPPVVAAGGAVESALPSAIVASGGGSGRAVTYEMSAPPRAPDRASQILAGECSILDRVVQRDLALQLRTLSDDQLRRVIDKVKEQINLAKAELIGLMAIRDESDFIKHAPRMRELFTGLFDCLYAPPTWFRSKPSAILDTYYLGAPYMSDVYRESPFLFALDGDCGADYLNFAFTAFVSIAEKLCSLPLEHQLLIDCEYPLHLAERYFVPRGISGSGSPLVQVDPEDNIVIIFRNYLELASPYLAGRLDLMHTLGIIAQGQDQFAKLERFKDDPNPLVTHMRNIATEVHEAVEFLHNTGSGMMRIEEWPSSVRPVIRALFDLTDTTNGVGFPEMPEIAHGSGWRLIRVPQENESIFAPFHPTRSDYVWNPHDVLNVWQAKEQFSILAETSAIGYALLAPLTSGAVPKSVGEIASFLDGLEALKGATSIQSYSEHLLSDDGVFVRLCQERGLSSEEIAAIIEDRRRSFLGAQKARDFLVKALAEGTPLEKLLANRRFIDHLYRYLFFLNSVEELPDLSLLEAASTPGTTGDAGQLAKVEALTRHNPLDRKVSVGRDEKFFRGYLLKPLTRVGGKTIVHTSSLADVSRLMSPSTIVIYQEARDSCVYTFDSLTSDSLKSGSLTSHSLKSAPLISVAMPA